MPLLPLPATALPWAVKRSDNSIKLVENTAVFGTLTFS
jgi:hypothetical protein